VVSLAVNSRLVFGKYLVGIAVVILRRSRHYLFLPSISRFAIHPTVIHLPVHLSSHHHALTHSSITPPSCTYPFSHHPTFMLLPVRLSSHFHALTGSPYIPPLFTYPFIYHPTAMHLAVHQSSCRFLPPGSPIILPSCTIYSEKMKVSLS
jgi:hypothetical protein